ncbi:cyclin-dependent kinase inhibitor 1B [Pygocentrus nattereri]|uniref:Cyclin-dependent kinase inhibitor domain-containing protein n=1 Tax=Pygocentrus nattereri TaxID=42514 RepID=A0A3B4BSJ4_PYGNA|nr:cyclin-dependent kinase inhibitor 1B [Pygocentrus nattereri]XP_017571220.1 cyclin-dependent kinase inhibitor 1B [Pygocentrus nattereri]
MSTAQFSSGSRSILGTLASSSSSSSRSFPLIRRDTPPPPHARVCRSLFGPVDHEELNREMKEKLHEIAERDQRRWNFNFGAGVPLPGEYEWEETPGETSPAFYQECVRVGKRSRAEKASQTPAQRPREEEKDFDSNRRESFRELRAGSSERTAPEKSSGSRTLAGRLTCRGVLRKRPSSALNTTLITDFYVKRRNSGGTTRCERISRKSLPPAAEDQTPRKRIR